MRRSLPLLAAIAAGLLLAVSAGSALAHRHGEDHGYDERRHGEEDHGHRHGGRDGARP